MAEQQTLEIEISIDVSNAVANLRRCGDAFHAAADRIERAGTTALGDQEAPTEPTHRSIGKVYEPNGWGDCEACGRPWPCPQARIDYMGSVGITPPHAVNAAPQVAPTEPLDWEKHAQVALEAMADAPQVAPEPDAAAQALWRGLRATNASPEVLAAAERVLGPEVAPEPERCPTCDGTAEWDWIAVPCPDPWHRPAPFVEGEQG